jgi:thiol-disulfide isomerase/thioredoxin
MDLWLAVALAGALVVLATVAGVAVTRLQHRTRRQDGAEIVRAAEVGFDRLGERATLLQFSTEYCSRCPAVHRLLTEISDDRAGVAHREVDLTHRPDLAARFHVLQTPTILILDSRGAVRARIGGTPARVTVDRELDLVTKENSYA